MKPLGPLTISVLAALLATFACSSPTNAGTTSSQDSRKTERAALEMSKAVVCKKVDAYEKFTTLPDASLTSEDKLVVYYRPLHFKVEPVDKPKPGHRYRAKFSQDGRIRRKGEKTVLQKKDLILEYEPFFDDPTERMYLTNQVSLKGLPPGDYEFDIILRDALEEGSASTQSLPFTIIPIPKIDPTPKAEGPAEPEGPPSPKVEPKVKKKPARSP